MPHILEWLSPLWSYIKYLISSRMNFSYLQSKRPDHLAPGLGDPGRFLGSTWSFQNLLGLEFRELSQNLSSFRSFLHFKGGEISAVYFMWNQKISPKPGARWFGPLNPSGILINYSLLCSSSIFDRARASFRIRMNIAGILLTVTLAMWYIKAGKGRVKDGENLSNISMNRIASYKNEKKTD